MSSSPPTNCSPSSRSSAAPRTPSAPSSPADLPSRNNHHRTSVRITYDRKDRPHPQDPHHAAREVLARRAQGQHPPGRRPGRLPARGGGQAPDPGRPHPARADAPDPRQRPGDPRRGRCELGRRDDDPRLPHRRGPLRRDERHLQRLLRGPGPHPAARRPDHGLRRPAARPPDRDRRTRRPRLSLSPTPLHDAHGTAPCGAPCRAPPCPKAP
ncbi:exported hypothetical protein [Streptomyces misionensis JCM 4497]